ncbi:hypothetical protein DPMN_015142 [Dreissena polymorpha]|uniref:Condensin-2 complex subunit H2 n=1 Tax=Dreissena polymorpha TaxID=45954 RepID=A0A9D4NAJ9_DREPO|nr:hypothetical protein DPMN_015142 [Dreissena polymorpha]
MMSATDNIHCLIEQLQPIPIKDLTKNWDVDIAAHLEDYLEELETIVISFDGGQTTMNFAQAAMLVQSSACVYSKKVEYLYSLVYQVLDLLANKKKQAQKSSVDDEGHDGDADFADKNADEQFLSLDDIQEGKNLNLKEDFESPEEFQLLPEMPLCLIPHEEGEKGENPLLSKSGEVLASRNDFKMNTSYIHAEGTLLLDMSHLRLLLHSLQVLEKLQHEAHENALEHTPEGHDAVEASNNPVDEGFPLEDEDPIPMDDGREEPLPEQISPQAINTPVVGGDMLRRSKRQKELKTSAATKPVKDPWKELDAHEESRPAKPTAKKGRSYKLCPGVEDKSKKRKRNSAATQNTQLEDLTSYFEKKVYSNVDKFPKSQLKVPTFHELEGLYWLEYKRRQTLHREQLKQLKQKAPDVAVEEEEEEEEENIDAFPALPAVLDDDIDDLVDDNLFNAIDNALSSNDPYDPAEPTEKPWAERLEDGIILNSYEDLVRKHVEEYMSSAQKYAQITELSRRVSEWEDKVLPRLEEEERRGSFDINTYGSAVLDRLDKGATVKFRDVVRGKPIHETCRTFLASLMLANTNNVKINEKGALSEGMDKFELTLLTRRRHFELLQDYHAPSLSEEH